MSDIIVIKRDGTYEEFDVDKISNSIMNAALVVGGEDFDLADELADEISDILESNGISEISAAELQQIVEKTLIEEGHASTAKVYILKGADRNRIREMDSALMKSFEEITFKSLEESETKRENANIDASTAMGTMLKYGSEGAKNFNLLYIISPDIAEAHKNGDIHIHDLDFLSLTETCLQIPLDKLFEHGFNTGHGFLRSPGGIRTAGALAAISIQSNQNDQHGGQSIPLFDYYLAPYVALTYVKTIAKVAKIKLDLEESQYKQLKEIMVDFWKKAEKHRVMDKASLSLIEELLTNFLTNNNIEYSDKKIDSIFNYTYEQVYDETFQSMEAFIHNLNTMHSRAGAQVPFSSINYGTDTSVEGRLVMETVLKNTMDGLGNGETPIFPIQIFKLKEGVSVNPEDPNYDLFKLACQVSAKRLYPNFVNLDAPYNKELYVEGRPETEMATMGCVEGTETFIMEYEGKVKNCTFKEVWNTMIWKYTERTHKYGTNSEYIDLEGLNIKAYDSIAGGFVKIKKLIRNSHVNNWRKLILNGGKVIVLTGDHPLNTKNRGRVYVDDLTLSDKLILTNSLNLETCGILEISANVDFGMHRSAEYSYDLETESDRFDLSGISSHNCRTRIGKNVYDPDKSVIPGRGNLSFTSINLPRLGVLADGDVDKFYKLLDSKLELVHRQLKERFEVQCLKHPINYPFLMGQGCWLGSDRLGPNDDIRSILKHGSLTVGFIGLAETLVALTGKHHGESEESQKLGLEIIQHMRDYTDAWSKNEKMNYTIIGTPAESLSGRFVRIDKQKFGIIKGVTDREYYTNSSHVPVYYPISAYKKIDIEAPYHSIENGGHIMYIELDGDPTKNIKAFMKIVKYMYDKDAGYMAINHPVDRDPVCGYVGIIGDTCPRCGRKEGEPMTLEMWNKIKGYANVDNASTCGVCGNPDEEADRLSNPIDTV